MILCVFVCVCICVCVCVCICVCTWVCVYVSYWLSKKRLTLSYAKKNIHASSTPNYTVKQTNKQTNTHTHTLIYIKHKYRANQVTSPYGDKRTWVNQTSFLSLLSPPPPPLLHQVNQATHSSLVFPSLPPSLSLRATPDYKDHCVYQQPNSAAQNSVLLFCLQTTLHFRLA